MIEWTLEDFGDRIRDSNPCKRIGRAEGMGSFLYPRVFAYPLRQLNLLFQRPAYEAKKSKVTNFPTKNDASQSSERVLQAPGCRCLAGNSIPLQTLALFR